MKVLSEFVKFENWNIRKMGSTSYLLISKENGKNLDVKVELYVNVVNRYLKMTAGDRVKVVELSKEDIDEIKKELEPRINVHD